MDDSFPQSPVEPAAGVRRVLVIGEDVVLAEALRNRLNSDRYAIVSIEDGMCGLKEAQRDDVALVITHAVLPRLDGFALCRMLKYDERFADRPIIMLSSLAQEKFERLSSIVGADAFFRKPVDVGRLAKRARELLSDTSAPLPAVIPLPASFVDEPMVEDEPAIEVEFLSELRVAKPKAVEVPDEWTRTEALDGEEAKRRQRRVTFL